MLNSPDKQKQPTMTNPLQSNQGQPTAFQHANNITFGGPKQPSMMQSVTRPVNKLSGLPQPMNTVSPPMKHAHFSDGSHRKIPNLPAYEEKE